MVEGSGHIFGAFDKDLGGIEDLVMRMGGLVEGQIEQATKVMLTRDVDLADEVREADQQIDELQLEIDQHVSRLIALRQPTAQDLRSVLAAMKIASDLERIGDHAKNMAKRTHALAQFPSVGEAPETIERMCEMVCRMMKDALDSYIARNSDVADEVRLRDEEVDQVYNDLFRVLLTHMLENPQQITSCMHLLFIAKNVERMGDLITSITEQVHFIVLGEMPCDERPKSDYTSTAVVGGAASGADTDTDTGSESDSDSD